MAQHSYPKSTPVARQGPHAASYELLAAAVIDISGDNGSYILVSRQMKPVSGAAAPWCTAVVLCIANTFSLNAVLKDNCAQLREDAHGVTAAALPAESCPLRLHLRWQAATCAVRNKIICLVMDPDENFGMAIFMYGCMTRLNKFVLLWRCVNVTPQSDNAIT